ncbi:MAG TPA: hypothetical protein VLA68_00265 [Nitrososphaera sp.]|nr:hypothetical protein [Nitrososphaera sp.]
MFGKKISWKAEYDDTIYKIYDWDGNLAGYFFPHYGDIEPRDQEDEIIDELNKTHANMTEATLLLPMVKLGLLDNEGGMDVDYVISSLEANTERTSVWKKWLQENSKSFRIFGAQVHTAREDRNMLSIGLGISRSFKLGEKEAIELLAPGLDRLHEDGLL